MTKVRRAGFSNGSTDSLHLLRFANEFTESHTQCRRQRVGNLYSHTDLPKFDGADVRPVNVRPLRKLLLR